MTAFVTAHCHVSFSQVFSGDDADPPDEQAAEFDEYLTRRLKLAFPGLVKITQEVLNVCDEHDYRAD